jgi:hypothetical protein
MPRGGRTGAWDFTVNIIGAGRRYFYLSTLDIGAGRRYIYLFTIDIGAGWRF